MERHEWLKWRKGGIGSSDAPILHGFHEYRTPLGLWHEKLPETELLDSPASYIQQKGNMLEPVARVRFTDALSEMYFQHVVLEPKMFENGDLNFIRASLDGFAEINGKRVGVEIKYLGPNRHALVTDATLPMRGGRVPDNYWIQIQHQFLAAGLDEQWFVSILDEMEPLAFCKVERDVEFIAKHIEVCAEFWRLVLNRIEPGLSAEDWKILRGFTKQAARYRWLKEKIKNFETELEEIEKDLVLHSTHKRMRAGNLKWSEVERKGSISYDKIPLLKGVDLEPYRKPSTKYWKFTLEEL